MNISKIKITDVIYYLRDLRVPNASISDKDKVIGVDSSGNYALINATRGGVIDIDSTAHKILCISGINIDNHSIVII